MEACLVAAAGGTSATALVVLQVLIGFATVYLGHELGHVLVARCFRVKVPRYYFGFDTSANPANFATRPVWQRMIIILAGPLMNLAMAVACASLAYWLGVAYTPCVIGTTVPGSPAFEANLEPGSRIVQIGRQGTESQHLRFAMDLVSRIAMAGSEEDVDLLIQSRDGAKKTWVSLRPRSREVGSERSSTIGITAAATTTLAGSESRPPVVSHLPAGQAEPTFRAGDRIVAIEIDGERFSVPDYFRLREIMAQHPEEEMTFVVERPAADTPQADRTATARVTVAPNPMRRVGLVMTMGAISSIQRESPAEQAGFQLGDRIATVNGTPVSDPLTLPEIFRRLAAQEVVVGVVRGRELVELKVVPRQPTTISVSPPGTPQAVQALGIAYRVLNRVAAVEPGSPADLAGLEPGDELISAEFVAAGRQQEQVEQRELHLDHAPIALGAESNWLQVVERLQVSLPDSKLRLIYLRGGRTGICDLQPVTSDEWFVPHRGFVLASLSEVHSAESVGEACTLGLRNTWEGVGLIFKFFRKLITGRISPKQVGGPGTIVMVASAETKQGTSRLLLFLALLNANLLFLNLLPIPGTDGGHLLFLATEGIQGSPVRRKTQLVLILINLLGIPCLLCAPIVPCLSQLVRLFGLIRKKSAVPSGKTERAGEHEQHELEKTTAEGTSSVRRTLAGVLLIILGLWIPATIVVLLALVFFLDVARMARFFGR